MTTTQPRSCKLSICWTFKFFYWTLI